MLLFRVYAVALAVLATCCSAGAQIIDSSHGQRITASPLAYEDDRIHVRIPETWRVEEAFIRVYGGVQAENIVGKRHVGAVLSKGKYRVYLLTHYEQASGIVGGRFAEIAKFVSPMIDPSVDADPCRDSGSGSAMRVSPKLDRVDLYLNTATATPELLARCGNPKVRGILWYGSYFTEHCPEHDPASQDCGGYFLNALDLAGDQSATQNTNFQMVFSATYVASKADMLPRRSDPQLIHVLDEASAIVRSITYKKPDAERGKERGNRLSAPLRN